MREFVHQDGEHLIKRPIQIRGVRGHQVDLIARGGSANHPGGGVGIVERLVQRALIGIKLNVDDGQVARAQIAGDPVIIVFQMLRDARDIGVIKAGQQKFEMRRLIFPFRIGISYTFSFLLRTGEQEGKRAKDKGRRDRGFERRHDISRNSTLTR